MIEYTIYAPTKTYERRLLNVSFICGVGKTTDEKAAQWFSGRDGFRVESNPMKENSNNCTSAKESNSDNGNDLPKQKAVQSARKKNKEK